MWCQFFWVPVGKWYHMLMSASVLSEENPLISACPQGVSEINSHMFAKHAFPVSHGCIIIWITYCTLSHTVSTGFSPGWQWQKSGSLLERLAPEPCFTESERDPSVFPVPMKGWEVLVRSSLAPVGDVLIAPELLFSQFLDVIPTFLGFLTDSLQPVSLGGHWHLERRLLSRGLRASLALESGSVQMLASQS